MSRQKNAAFTLVEMLVVISIIAALAAMTAVAAKSITEKRTIKLAEAHMRQVELAILDYKAKLGFYPPDNGNQGSTNWTLLPPLFYELTGAVPVRDNSGKATGDFRSVLGDDTIGKVALNSEFGRAGLANSSDETRKNFFPSMLPFHFNKISTPSGYVKILTVPAKGPEVFPADRFVNPWRYNSSNPTNNPGSFDLWVELKFDSKIVVVGNWKRRQQ